MMDHSEANRSWRLATNTTHMGDILMDHYKDIQMKIHNRCNQRDDHKMDKITDRHTHDRT